MTLQKRKVMPHIFLKLSLQSGNLSPQEAATRGILLKKVFLKISQNSQENTCARFSFFNKVTSLKHRCFPANFAKNI